MSQWIFCYHSKHLLRDPVGRNGTVPLNASQISILNVALALYGHSNPHAPQASFCGNTVGPMCDISFNNLSAIADVFEEVGSAQSTERRASPDSYCPWACLQAHLRQRPHW